MREIQSLQSDKKQLSTENTNLLNEIKLKTDEAACEIEALEEDNIAMKRKLQDMQNKSVDEQNDLIDKHENLMNIFSQLQQDNSHLIQQLNASETKIKELVDSLETMKQDMVHKQVQNSAMEKSLRTELELLQLEHENCTVQMVLSEQEIQQKLDSNTELNGFKMRLKKMEQMELTLRAELEESYLSYKPMAEDNENEQVLVSEQNQLKDQHYNDSVSEQELIELNKQTEKLKLENQNLKAEIDKLTNSSARLEMQLRSEIEDLVTSKEDTAQLAVEKAHDIDSFICPQNVLSVMELKFMQSVERALREEIEDLLMQITDIPKTEKEILAEFGQNYALPNDTEPQLDVLDTQSPEEYGQLLERYVALEETLDSVLRDKEALENSLSQMERNGRELASPSHDTDYVAELQQEVSVIHIQDKIFFYA